MAVTAIVQKGAAPAGKDRASRRIVLADDLVHAVAHIDAQGGVSGAKCLNPVTECGTQGLVKVCPIQLVVTIRGLPDNSTPWNRLFDKPATPGFRVVDDAVANELAESLGFRRRPLESRTAEYARIYLLLLAFWD